MQRLLLPAYFKPETSMKNEYLFYFLIILFFSCNNAQNRPSSIAESTISYPEAINKVFDSHGGLDIWKNQKLMTYEIKRDNGNEKQIIDLENRRERIEGQDFKMGFDGADFWLEADSTFKRNPIFYKNLIFYFYAMPFVLADPGINYQQTEDLIFENTNYPGFRISYNENIGVSPEDEYFIHYDPQNYEMKWLGYTVTYYTKEKSDKVKYIRYDDWEMIDGLKLPGSLAWYTIEDGKPDTLRNRVEFEEIKLSKEKAEDDVFKKTKTAEIVKE